ncbi:ABC transporter ATP-binding protein [Bauldia sp.]|uniref:ABC transporter ATP-binding protein n=1 Tax=Bauldia sp. TaxID=2575872 RepID=UPI003BAB045B
MTFAIELSGLTKRYADQVALAGVDLTVENGAFCVLLGPSGCGKSTLLRAVAGLEPPTSGAIRLGGKPVADVAHGVHVAPGMRDLGMVFQSYALWPHKTVRDNIAWPLKIAGVGKAERRARLAEVAEMLDIAPYLARYPAELSGGQQQRVAIARSIAPKPSLLLFDEPLSNLDTQLRVEMRAELLKLHSKTGATIVYVTHDQVEAMTMATQIVVMNAGRIEQNGSTASILSDPQTAFVAGFVGNPPANLFALRRNGTGWTLGDQAIALQSLPAQHETVRAMVRPSRIGLSDQPGERRLQARFVEALPFGAQHFIQLESNVGRITVLVDDWQARDHGSALYVELPLQPDAVFDADGARLT